MLYVVIVLVLLTRPSELLKDEEYELTVSAQVLQVSMTLSRKKALQKKPVWLLFVAILAQAEGRQAAVYPVTETADKRETHGREHLKKYRIRNLFQCIL